MRWSQSGLLHYTAFRLCPYQATSGPVTEKMSDSESGFPSGAQP